MTSRFFALGAILFALAVWQTPNMPAVAQEVTLRFSQFTPRTHFYHRRILEPWVADVHEATEGRVRIEFTTAPLGPFPRNFDMARQGVADITAGNHGVTPGRFQITQIVEGGLPGAKDSEAVSVALWRTHEEYLHKANEHEGTHLLTLHTSGSIHFFSLEKPIERIGDFKGLKFLAPNQTGAKIATALGGIPVIKPVTEYYDTVSKGVVDLAMSTNTAVARWGAEQFVKYQTRVPGGLMYGTFFVVVNQAKWDTISANDQDAIMSVSGEEYAKLAGSVFAEEDVRALDERKAGTIRIMDAGPDLARDVHAAFSFVTEEWIAKADAKGIDGAAALKYLREQAAGYK